MEQQRYSICAIALVLCLSGPSPVRSTPQLHTDVPVYMHPIPGANRVSAATTLAFRFEGFRDDALASRASQVSLTGRSGRVYPFTKGLSDDGRTLILKPVARFGEGDTIDVTIRGEGEFSYFFAIASTPSERSLSLRSRDREDPCVPPTSGMTDVNRTLVTASAGRSAMHPIPSDFPRVNVSVNTSPSPGNVFMNNWGGTPYVMILGNDGESLFYRRMPSRARDFKLQPTGMLTYRLGPPFDKFYGMDSTYAVVDTFEAGHGYGTDEHELCMLPNGHVLLIALDYQRVDMSAVVPGGQQNALVIGNHIQEIDTEKNVVFEWRSWDHYAITDAVNLDLTANVIDYVHMNSISVDDDGNLIISSRHLSEVTKIDRSTGSIVWRLGGKNNDFIATGLEGPFSWQHDARALGSNRYTVFDNGNWNSPRETRVLEYELDTVNALASVVWQYRHSPPFYTWWMGNAQRVQNGNTVIGWADGTLPKLMEVTPAGDIVLQLDFVNPAHCYRIFKFEWEGRAQVPYLTAEPVQNGVRLLFPVFGDTSVSTYRIYRGPDPGPTTISDSSSSPVVTLQGLTEGTHYFRVTAVDTLGNESGFSNEEQVFVRNIQPGQNMVTNGTFDDGTTGWWLGQFDGGAAQMSVSGAGECVLAIENGGPQVWSVQLVQGNIPLVSGRNYVLSFNARASAPRTIDAKVEQDGGSFLNYSNSSAFYVTAATSHYEVPFTMQHPTDYKARVTFNCGQSALDLFFDNISVVEDVATSVAGQNEALPSAAYLYPAWPNPFNPSVELRYSVPGAGLVQILIFDATGRLVSVLDEGWRSPGEYTARWTARGSSSGAYFVQLRSGTSVSTRRITLLK